MILFAMKSTIDSAYEPPAANADGRAVREIIGLAPLLRAEAPIKEIPGLGSAQPLEKARFGQGNQRESKGFFVAFHKYSWSNRGGIVKSSSCEP
jgi:hypothetical protein